MAETEFTFADASAAAPVQQLLRECGLPYEDIGNHLDNFIIAKQGDKAIGLVGLELYGKVALLRSLAVAAPHRGRGIARALCARAEAHALLKGVSVFYLLTTTAAGFFSKLDFSQVARDEVPEAIKATREFHSLCPASAVCMMKEMGKEARYFPREVLVPQPDVPGARMWGIALEKTMFTYFEVEPRCRFELHRHASEQITMVLEGELFFEASGRTIRVRQGEVIALPANLPHAAFTREESVKAVDAWSPVMEKYKK